METKPAATSPRVVVFDLGKVLVDFDYGIAARNLATRGKVPMEKIRQFIDHTALLFRYETGLLTDRQFYDEFCAATGYGGGEDEFGACFGDIFAPIPQMIELHAALRKRGLPTYIFSNTNALAVRHIRQNFPFFADFDGHILSYQERSMKPDAKIYEAVERRSGRRQAEILYVDDRPENIEAGAARGWQVVLQETPEKTRQAIERLGLL